MCEGSGSSTWVDPNLAGRPVRKKLDDGDFEIIQMQRGNASTWLDPNLRLNTTLSYVAALTTSNTC